MKALDLLHAMVLESGDRWGEIAADFQVRDAEAILSDDDGPRWHYQTRPRGGSKSTDAACVSLAWLATEAAPGDRGYCIAADKDQSALIVDAASGLVQRTPELRSVITVQAFKISATNGATIEALAADGSSAFGLRGKFFFADEVAQWSSSRNARRVWTAIVSSLGKVKGSRFVVMTSAGEPSHWSYDVLKKAKATPDRWRVSEIVGALPWVDEADLLAQGLRDSEYARLHLNQWTQSESRLVSHEDLEAAAVLDGEQEAKPGTRYIISVDLGLVNDKSVVAVGHSEPMSPEPNAPKRVVIDSLRKWRGTRKRPVQIEDVESYIVLASQRYNTAKVLCDPWQAAGMIQRLKRQGVPCEQFPFTTSSTGRIGQALHLALRNRLLWLPDDPDLLNELARVRLRETGIGQARLDHDSGDHDDQAVAIAIICGELLGNVRPSGGKEWLESLAAQNGTTAPEAPTPTETPQQPWSPWSQIPDRPANEQTAAALQLLDELHRSNSPFGQLR